MDTQTIPPLDASGLPEFRRRMIALPDRGGEAALIEMGPQDRAPDVLFVHANGFNALTYRHLLAPLAAAGRRVLITDLRGHGRSTLPADPEGRESWLIFREDFIALLEALGEAPAVISGHSMGGTTGALTAAKRPDLVRQLVLFDPVVITPETVARAGGEGLSNSPLAQGARRRRAVFASREAVFAAYHGRGAFRSWDDAVLADYLADGFAETEDGQVALTCAPGWEAANFSSHDHDTLGAFANSQCPIHILKAEHESTCNFGDREAAITASGRVHVEVVPGTTHFLPMERPARVVEALAAALG